MWLRRHSQVRKIYILFVINNKIKFLIDELMILTGTGKTATFSISILQQIDTTIKECQALILAPTRELAQQVSKWNIVLLLIEKKCIWINIFKKMKIKRWII